MYAWHDDAANPAKVNLGNPTPRSLRMSSEALKKIMLRCTFNELIRTDTLFTATDSQTVRQSDK